MGQKYFVISYECAQKRKFRTAPRISKFLRDLAKVVISDGNWIQINTQAKACMCQRYQDKLVCKHLVAACLKGLKDSVRLEANAQILPAKKNILKIPIKAKLIFFI